MDEKENISINNLIGGRLKQYRRLRNITLVELSKKVLVSPQQLQKYESGKNRISASMMVLVCSAIKIPPYSILENIFDDEDYFADDKSLSLLVKNYYKINSHQPSH